MTLPVPIKIQEEILEIRGKKVLLDSQLAKLYGVTTGNLNKAVKRNITRFPEDFMFALTDEEFSNLKFQFGIPNGRGGRRTNPYAFTEQGVAMLSSVLNSEAAIQVNIHIMRAFVGFRKLLADKTDNISAIKADVTRLREYIEEILSDQNEINEETQAQIDAISQSIADLQSQTPKSFRKVGYIDTNSNLKNDREES